MKLGLPLTALPQKRRRRLGRALGLCFALVLPVAYTVFVGPLWLEPRLNAIPYALSGMAVFWGSTLGVLVVVRYYEGRSLTSLGLRPLTMRGLLLALGFGIGLSLSVPLLTLAAALFLPSPDEGSVLETAVRFPVWLLLLSVVTAAVTEEILFRAYPLERLPGAGRFPFAGILLGLGAFVTVHASGWNAAHVLGVVLPLGLALTALYLWRRELWFVVIVHALVDLPLVVLALLESPPS